MKLSSYTGDTMSVFLLMNQVRIVSVSCSPQISVRLLAHKIQSPQDWESLQALTVSLTSAVP